MRNRAKKIAETIRKAQEIHIVTHIDADGVTAGAIAASTLERIDKTFSIQFVKQLDNNILYKLEREQHELVWFTDIGSSVADYEKVNKVITDHHVCTRDKDYVFHLNPHLFGLDGSTEISGAGVTYLVAKELCQDCVDLTYLAIVGACGDLQDIKQCKLQGLNRKILEEGERAGVLKKQIDIRYFGRETRPVYKLLQFATDPLIPGLTGREDACISFLNEYNIPLKDGDNWRRWIDLKLEEKRKIVSEIMKLLLVKGFGYKIAARVLGEVYILTKEDEGTELHDAKEFATMLNATARYGESEVGLNVCLGDRDKWFKKARNLLRNHRQNLVNGLQLARDEGIVERKFLQYFHAGEGIKDTIVGIVTGMMLSSGEVNTNLPLIGFANTENGDVKVSARARRELADKGLNLSVAMQNAAEALNGVGGGHNVAAGATIPKGKEEEFLEILEKEIKNQLNL
ncbi:MAG: recombinase RecJ [Thermoplasmata archaeon]|nr:MAG: recombinase RecJ [Thermoplasmata archaeon]